MSANVVFGIAGFAVGWLFGAGMAMDYCIRKLLESDVCRQAIKDGKLNLPLRYRKP